MPLSELPPVESSARVVPWRSPRAFAGSAAAVRALGWRLPLFAAAYFATGGLGQGLALIPGVAITFWPPVGILLMMLVLHPRTTWPAWLAAGGVAELACNAVWFLNPLPFALVYYAANALEALAAAWLIRRFSSDEFRLERWRECLVFLLAAATAPVVSATIIAGLDAAIGKHAFSVAWLLVWLGDSSGILVSGPLTLTLVLAWRERRGIPLARALEAVAVGVALIGINLLVGAGWLPTAYLSLPVLLWAGVRFQLPGAACAVALICLTTAFVTMSGAGEFGGPPAAQAQRSLGLKLFLGVSAISALAVAVLSRQHREAINGLRQLNTELEERVASRTATLRESEARLRDREAHLRMAMDSSLAIAFEWDVVTDRVRRLMSRTEAFPLTENDTLAGVARAVHPEDRAQFHAAVQAALADPAARYVAEFRIVQPDGQVRWLGENGRVDFASDGRPVRLIGISQDVTARKRAEEALRASEERHRLLFEANPHPMWVFDEETLQILAVNRAAVQHYGYSREEFARITVADLRPAEEVPRFLAAMGTVGSREVRNEGGWRHRKKDGTLIDVEITSETLAFEGRRARVVLATDVTDRLRTAAVLRLAERERLIRRLEERTDVSAPEIVAVAPALLYVYDLQEAKSVFQNRPLTDLLGYPDEEARALGERAWRALIHPEDRARFGGHRATLQGLRAGEGALFCYRMRHADGDWRWILSRDVVLPSDSDAASRFVVGVASDITEQKVAEELARASEERLQLAVEAGKAGTWDLDLRTGRNVWSESHFTLLGIPLTSDRSATEAMWQQIVVSEDLPALMAEMARAEREHDLFRSEHRLRRVDTGEILWARAAGRFLRDEAGQPVRFVGVFYDITERKKAEQALAAAEVRLREHADRLEEQVRERTAKLQAAFEQMEEFSYSVSHDLRAPLRAIASYARVVLEDYGDRLDDKGRDYLRRVMNAGDRMNQLTSDLLTYGQVLRGSLVLGRLSLDPLVAELAHLQRAAAAGDAEISVEHPLLDVIASESLVTQVVTNLLGNALKFARPGVPVRVKVRTERVGEQVRLWVEDNGIGIAPEHHGRVWNIFERLHPRGPYDGTGIGLAVVRKAVERMGGSVGLESDGVSGTRFWVLLPAAE